MLETVFGYFPRLKERLRQDGGKLSGGEQQMLTIARGLMAKPKLMLIDEPSEGLAPKIVHEIMEIIKKLQEDGVTILLVEQHAEAAMRLSEQPPGVYHGEGGDPPARDARGTRAPAWTRWSAASERKYEGRPMDYRIIPLNTGTIFVDQGVYCTMGRGNGTTVGIPSTAWLRHERRGAHPGRHRHVRHGEGEPVAPPGRAAGGRQDRPSADEPGAGPPRGHRRRDLHPPPLGPLLEHEAVRQRRLLRAGAGAGIRPRPHAASLLPVVRSSDPRDRAALRGLRFHHGRRRVFLQRLHHPLPHPRAFRRPPVRRRPDARPVRS